MDWFHYIDTSRVMVFSLVFIRVSGIVIMAPVFGGQDIPMRVRALFAFALAILIMPSQWTLEIVEPSSLPGYVLYILAELVIGVSIGTAVNIFFSGVYMAGDAIGRLGGLTSSQLFDPTSGESLPLLAIFLRMLAITVFACMGGLRLMMAALLDSFEALPVGSDAVQVDIAYALLTILSWSFSLAFRIAAPAMLAILVSMLVIGLLGRTLPQLNLMSVGFGISSIIMLAVTMMTLGATMLCFQDRIVDVIELIFRSFHTDIEHEQISLAVNLAKNLTG